MYGQTPSRADPRVDVVGFSVTDQLKREASQSDALCGSTTDRKGALTLIIPQLPTLAMER